MRHILWLVPLCLLTSCGDIEPVAAQGPQQQVPNFYQNVRDAMPFPKILPPTVFRDPRQIRVYEIAARIPGVLAQQPCYCYCDKGHGHKGLLDCHRDAHSAG